MRSTSQEIGPDFNICKYEKDPCTRYRPEGSCQDMCEGDKVFVVNRVRGKGKLVEWVRKSSIYGARPAQVIR